VELPEMREHDPLSLQWALRPRKLGEDKHTVRNIYKELFTEPDVDGYIDFLWDKYNAITEHEQRWEAVQTEDAEVVIVAYGITARVAKSAVRQARAQGIRLGLIRPITLWPFPKKAFDTLGSQVKGIVCAEINILGQMREDVVLACENRYPVVSYCEFSYVPKEQSFIDHALDILNKL
jgi:2-oxoglutarate ferredoxin oxidoreductase subunit alpha